MSAIILAVGAALVFLVLVIGIAVAVTASSKTWAATFGRHQILLENRYSEEKLYVDGKLVDQHSAGLVGGRSTLRGQIVEPNGTTHIVEGKIRPGMVSVRGHIFVDNQFVGGDQV